jgi:hypothetical protein
MMRLRKEITVGGRQVIVHEFDGDTAYLLLEWLERVGGTGLKASELMIHRTELLSIVKDCIEPIGAPIDFSALGLGALLELVEGLQAVNQAFLKLLTKMRLMPFDTSPAP